MSTPLVSSGTHHYPIVRIRQNDNTPIAPRAISRVPALSLDTAPPPRTPHPHFTPQARKQIGKCSHFADQIDHPKGKHGGTAASCAANRGPHSRRANTRAPPQILAKDTHPAGPGVIAGDSYWTDSSADVGASHTTASMSRT